MSRIPLLPWTVVQTARHWSTESVARSRRNALAANTALAARRAEREEVEAFLADHDERAAMASLRVPQARRGLG